MKEHRILCGYSELLRKKVGVNIPSDDFIEIGLNFLHLVMLPFRLFLKITR
jgi:hypothetical protein